MGQRIAWHGSTEPEKNIRRQVNLCQVHLYEVYQMARTCSHRIFDSSNFRINQPPRGCLLYIGKEGIAEIQISVLVQLGHNNCNNRSIVPFHWTPDFWILRFQSFRRQGSTQPRRATAPQVHVLCVKASIVISTCCSASASAFASGGNQPKPGRLGPI